MNRRHFLKNTGMTGIGLSMTPVVSAIIDNLHIETSTLEPFFKLSLAQWSLHRSILETKEISNLDFAEKARELGFEGIEYVSQLYPLDPVNISSSLSKLVYELKLRSNENNVDNVLIMVDDEGELAASSKHERNEAINRHSKWIDAASELKCHSIRVNLFGKDTEHDFYKWKEASIDGLGRLAEYALKNNINVIVENHGGLSSAGDKLTEVIKAINLKNCGVLPDFGNFCVKRQGGERWGAPCIEEYDRYKGTLEMMPFAHGVSAKSYDFDSNGNETTIDYQRMLKIVKESGYNGFIGVEYEGQRLSENDGIIATKKLLLKAASQL